jgi:hypothetical protein
MSISDKAPNGDPASVSPVTTSASTAEDNSLTTEFITPPLRARHVFLKPIAPSDYPFLQMLETAGDPAPRWRHRGGTPSPDQWAQGLWAGVLVQFLVVGVESSTPIGRVVIYRPNFQDRHAYFAALRFQPRQRSPLMILGISLFLRYVFSYWDFEKLYMEVPEYSLPQFASGLGRFFEIEGRLRGHLQAGDRSWDQLIVALHRDAAALHGARLRLDRGQRSVIGTEPAVMPAVVGSPSAGPEPKWDPITWEEFVAEVATIAQVPLEEVQPETRVLEDLALDSLALTELGVVLIDRYDSWSISRDLETRSWEGLTVRSLYHEYLTSAPAAT